MYSQQRTNASHTSSSSLRRRTSPAQRQHCCLWVAGGFDDDTPRAHYASVPGKRGGDGGRASASGLGAAYGASAANGDAAACASVYMGHHDGGAGGHSRQATRSRSANGGERTLLQEVPNMVLLAVLYMMQGVPLGLTMGSVPLLLAAKASYTQVRKLMSARACASAAGPRALSVARITCKAAPWCPCGTHFCYIAVNPRCMLLQ